MYNLVHRIKPQKQHRAQIRRNNLDPCFPTGNGSFGNMVERIPPIEDNEQGTRHDPENRGERLARRAVEALFIRGFRAFDGAGELHAGFEAEEGDARSCVDAEDGDGGDAGEDAEGLEDIAFADAEEGEEGEEEGKCDCNEGRSLRGGLADCPADEGVVGGFGEREEGPGGDVERSVGRCPSGEEEGGVDEAREEGDAGFGDGDDVGGALAGDVVG